MDKSVLIATVYVAKDGISCDCVCPLRDVKQGDQVLIFLNNAPTTGDVTAIREMNISELPNSVFDMKQIIRKVSSAATTPTKVKNTISLGDLVNRNRNITIIGRGAMGTFLFSNDDIEAYGAQVGNYIYFMDDEGTHFRSVILKIADSAEVCTPRLHIEAVVQDAHLDELLECQYKLSDKKATLTSCLTAKEELTIDECFTHIAARSFERTDTLRALTITAEVEVEAMAFAYNESLTQIRITNYRSKIARNSFDGCRNLKEVILPITMLWRKDELIAYYGDRIRFEFELGTGSFEHEGVVYTKDFKSIVCAVDKSLTSFTAPLEVESIWSYAFMNCSELKQFCVSPFTKEVGISILSGCMALQKVTFFGDSEVDIVLLFGEDPISTAKAETLQHTDGTSRIFYLPPKCEYYRSPSPTDILRDVKPENLKPEICRFIGDYYASVHRPSEAIKYLQFAAMQGYDMAYQQLVKYAQVNGLEEYFSVELYEYADRSMTIKPFLHMLATETPELSFPDLPEPELMKSLLIRENLVSLLKTIAGAGVYDLDLLQTGLNRIYRFTKSIHDDVIKVLFLQCIDKVGQFKTVVPWRDELLHSVGAKAEYVRLFAFDFVDVWTERKNEKAEEYIAALPDSMEKQILQSAYAAAIFPGPNNTKLFNQLLDTAKLNHDEFYEKCAVLALIPYLLYCWRDKSQLAQFRDTLELALLKAQEGYAVVGAIALAFKQNLKKTTPKHFFLACAEQLFTRGLLNPGTFHDMLDTRNAQEEAKFYCKYPEYFDTNDKETMLMQKLTKNWFCIPGTRIGEECKRGIVPVMYKQYEPELVEGKLMLFLNEHEAVSYFLAHALPIPNSFYYITCAKALSIMDKHGLSEATLFPRFFNKRITRDYINSIFDVD